MAATTPLTLIDLALKDAGILGVGQTALPEDVNDAFTRLNFMLAQWQRKRWMVWHLVTTGLVSTGASAYTIGIGGDYNIKRPDRLEDGNFLRQIVQSQPNQIDYPLELLESMEDYNRIALKQLVSFGSYIFYDATYPLGTIRLYPVPNPSIYSIFICTKAELPQFTSLTQEVLFPEEYRAAIYHNLVVRLRSAYQLPPDPIQMGLAKEGMNVIRGANTQIGRLRMPSDLVRPGIYNPYSDQLY